MKRISKPMTDAKLIEVIESDPEMSFFASIIRKDVFKEMVYDSELDAYYIPCHRLKELGWGKWLTLSNR